MGLFWKDVQCYESNGKIDLDHVIFLYMWQVLYVHIYHLQFKKLKTFSVFALEKRDEGLLLKTLDLFYEYFGSI